MTVNKPRLDFYKQGNESDGSTVLRRAKMGFFSSDKVVDDERMLIDLGVNLEMNRVAILNLLKQVDLDNQPTEQLYRENAIVEGNRRRAAELIKSVLRFCEEPVEGYTDKPQLYHHILLSNPSNTGEKVEGKPSTIQRAADWLFSKLWH